MSRHSPGKRSPIQVLAVAAILVTTGPAQAERDYPPDWLLYEYVMPIACPMAELLGYQKVDGRWVGGRSLRRGEWPVSGRSSKLLVESTFARSGFFRFDAERFRNLKNGFDYVATDLGSSPLPDADTRGDRLMIEHLDEKVAVLLKDWTGPDPWTLCDQVEAK